MPQIQNPSLTGFNNSVIVGQHRFDAQKFTDLNSLYSLYKKDSLTTYKGMIHLFNQRKLMNTPLISMTELNNSVILVNGAEGKFRYSVPYEIGLPYIVECMTKDIQKPGIDGQKFKIKLSENCFNNTDVITYDYRDGISLYITEEEIYKEQDGYVYTVMIPQKANNRDTWFPQQYLQPGVEYMKLSNVNGEYDTQKSTVSLRNGVLDLEMQLGGERSVYHWITAYADMLKVNNDDPRYSYMSQYGLNSPKAVTWFMNKDANGNPLPKTTRWMNTVETMLWAEMKMMEERDLMWSKGGLVGGSGRRQVRVNTGLYEQMRNGNRIQYTKLTLSLIEQTLANLYYNSGVPIDQRRTEIQVGTGALIEVSKLLEHDFRSASPFLTLTGDVKGLLYGDPMNLGYGYRFTSKRFPVAGIVEFKYNPALDNRYNRQQDGLIGEYPIESYTLMVMDVTDSTATNAVNPKSAKVEYRVEDGFNSSSNICLIKPEGYSDTYWGYEVGTQHPFGPQAMKGMFSTSQRAGYAIWMKNFSSIWLKDATKTILIEKTRTL